MFDKDTIIILLLSANTVLLFCILAEIKCPGELIRAVQDIKHNTWYLQYDKGVPADLTEEMHAHDEYGRVHEE